MKKQSKGFVLYPGLFPIEFMILQNFMFNSDVFLQKFKMITINIMTKTDE